MQKGHPSYGGGRPRTAIPQKEELIELGKDLVEWASEKSKKGEPIRVRFCDWYTDRGFIRKQWESFCNLPEFSWYYEKARALMAGRYVDGTVNPSIAHRYLRIYDPEMRDAENQDADDNELRKVAALKRDAEVNAQATAAVLKEIQDSKRELK
jgi:hypothetical protein